MSFITLSVITLSVITLSVVTPLLTAEHYRLLAPCMELPATGGYVSTVSCDLPHSAQDVSVH